MSDFPGLTHVAVTVSDLASSTTWYSKLFGSEPVLSEDTGPFHHNVWLIGSGQLFGIHAFPALDSSEAANSKRPGLDHVAFGCASRSELESHLNRLNDLGIAHGGIVDAHYGSGLSFKDPDNIALEFFAPPA